MKSRSENGLVLLPKIKYEHVYLSNFSKMRVDLAAQVSCKKKKNKDTEGHNMHFNSQGFK